MPRPRRTTSAPRVNPGQAQYVLERLISDRRVSAGEVNRYDNDMQREISDLEQRLQNLRAATGRPVGAAPSSATAGPRRRRRAAITPEQAASRVLQGRYLGLIRQIPAKRRARYAKVARDRGREAAIKEMQSALNK
jgi:hypothetical protein